MRVSSAVGGVRLAARLPTLGSHAAGAHQFGQGPHHAHRTKASICKATTASAGQCTTNEGKPQAACMSQGVCEATSIREQGQEEKSGVVHNTHAGLARARQQQVHRYVSHRERGV